MIPSATSNKATTASLKRHNETLLLREIYAHPAISRVRLAALTNLSRPSVTELTQNLIKRGLVIEVGPEKQTDRVGKKATLLTFNKDIYQLVTATVNDVVLTAALLDLRMEVLEQRSVPMNGATSTALVDALSDLIAEIVPKATRPLLGIAVGTPGVIDMREGVIQLATYLEWVNVPLARILADRFKVPVYVGNDSNLAAIGESRFGMAQNVKDLVVLKIGSGIGVGILAGGHLVEGNAFAAGELGHTPFPTLNELCLCGRRGCLETAISGWSLKRRAQDIVRGHPASLLARLSDGTDVTISTVRQALEAGDPQCTELVTSVATYLSQAIIIILHLLNPQMIVLTGNMVGLGDRFLTLVRENVKAWAFPYMTEGVEIVANEQDERSILLGAGALLLERELGL
jgi:predicted NBD/HSP70 family sugar kinase